MHPELLIGIVLIIVIAIVAIFIFARIITGRWRD